jgi:hypothetical protein
MLAAAWVAAIGAVLGGLALPIAFIQIGAQRQDRLRTQVGKVGAWLDTWERPSAQYSDWAVNLHVRNSSDLPITLQRADLTVTVRPGGTTTLLLNDWAVIPPGQTLENTYTYVPDFEGDQPLQTLISHLTVMDAAGLIWDIQRPRRSGPPRQVGWWRRRYRQRHFLM